MLRALLDLLLPERCAGCGRPDALVCRACVRAVRAAPREVFPDPCPPWLPPTFAGCEYDGVVRRLLVAHKERGRHDLSELLGRVVADAVRHAVDPARGMASAGPLLIVPVPSRRASTRARGYDHARRLAVASGRWLADLHPQVLPALALHGRVADQGGLGAAARAANVAGALRLDRPLPRTATVVVIDDVVTTGSTLAEAARALRAAGVGDVRAAVVAATRKRYGSARAAPAEAEFLPGCDRRLPVRAAGD